jgi:signal transduction histidine kinase
LRASNEELSAENSLRRKTEGLLEENRQRLRQLASQLTLSEESQRHDLAVQLHDTIGQELAMARMRLAHYRAAPSADREEHLGAAAELLDAAIGHVRNLTHELGASVLYELGLPAALRSLGDYNGKQHNLEFVYWQEGEYPQLDKELEVHLFRTARELVYNVIKHAHATRFLIGLDCAADEIAVCVEDNGCGIPPEANLPKRSAEGSGFGLFSIRERLADLGGRLDLAPTECHGTVATVTVPVPKRIAEPRIKGEKP